MSDLAKRDRGETGAAREGGDSSRVVVGAVGDVMPGDSFYFAGIGIRSISERHGDDYVLAPVKDLLRACDLVIGNLECVISDAGLRRGRLSSFQYRGRGSFAKALASANFGVLTVANNHILEHGREAMLESIDNLRTCGLRAVGLPAHGQRSSPDCLFNANGVRFAMAAYCLQREKNTEGIVAEEEDIIGDVRHFRPLADRVVVSLHWGTEYMSFPSPRQVVFARRLVDAGADIILGHHPHCLQGIERYRNGVIAYSLGNFVCDGWHESWCQSVLLRLEVPKRGDIKHSAIPVTIGKDFRTRPAEGTAREEAEARFSRMCDDLKTNPVLMREDQDEYERIASRLTLRRRKEQHRVILKNLGRLPRLFALQVAARPFLKRVSGIWAS